MRPHGRCFSRRTARQIFGFAVLVLAAVVMPPAAAAPATTVPTTVMDCTLAGELFSNSAMQVAGGTGSYYFTNASPLTFDCVTVANLDQPAAADQSIDIDIVDVTSLGTYDNLSCGTGTMYSAPGRSTASAVSELPQPSPLGDNTGLLDSTVDGMGYELVLAAGQGSMLVGGAGIGGDAEGKGVISIQPTSPVGALGSCGSDFEAEGSFVAYSPPLFGVF